MFYSVEVGGIQYPITTIRAVDEISFQPIIKFFTVINGDERMMQASYTIDLAESLKVMHALDIEEELIKLLKVEIKDEIKRIVESM